MNEIAAHKLLLAAWKYLLWSADYNIFNCTCNCETELSSLYWIVMFRACVTGHVRFHLHFNGQIKGNHEQELSKSTSAEENRTEEEEEVKLMWVKFSLWLESLLFQHWQVFFVHVSFHWFMQNVYICGILYPWTADRKCCCWLNIKNRTWGNTRHFHKRQSGTRGKELWWFLKSCS